MGNGVDGGGGSLDQAEYDGAFVGGWSGDYGDGVSGNWLGGDWADAAEIAGELTADGVDGSVAMQQVTRVEDATGALMEEYAYVPSVQQVFTTEGGNASQAINAFINADAAVGGLGNGAFVLSGEVTEKDPSSFTVVGEARVGVMTPAGNAFVYFIYNMNANETLTVSIDGTGKVSITPGKRT